MYDLLAYYNRIMTIYLPVAELYARCLEPRYRIVRSGSSNP